MCTILDVLNKPSTANYQVYPTLFGSLFLENDVFCVKTTYMANLMPNVVIYFKSKLFFLLRASFLLQIGMTVIWKILLFQISELQTKIRKLR